MFASTVISSHVVLLPVKPPAQGKSRIRGVADAVRRDLAEAFALDTATACLSTPAVGAVLAITDDAAFAARLGHIGCAAIPDGVSNDLNATLRLGAAEANRRWPHWRPVALLGDVPALTPTDLAHALALAPPDRAAYVADADDLGSTLYTAPADHFDPQFGRHSRASHDAVGADRLDGPLATLRRDVDDLEALKAAAALGLGPYTRAVVEAHQLI